MLWFRASCPFKKAQEKGEQALLGRRAQGGAGGLGTQCCCSAAASGLEAEPTFGCKECEKRGSRASDRRALSLASQGGVSKDRDPEIPVESKLAARPLFFPCEEQLLPTATLTEPVFWKRPDGFEPRLESICPASHEPLRCFSEGCEEQWSSLVSLGPLPLERNWKLFGP
ncbi:hypothetical protein HPG69_004268 [Diceros bicornis minor]|uniref:Uncharacterized protein n=1 Tax=Diceros bicornis minor TaxID=77932 RepID=A0A7J7EB11_DICBM|nr:hypothetical protein HPG69_004268 [Diceros bicornis minor]